MILFREIFLLGRRELCLVFVFFEIEIFLGVNLKDLMILFVFFIFYLGLCNEKIEILY